MKYQFQSVPIAIQPADGDGPVAFMHLLTVGRGSLLPAGATWLDEASGWWQRESTDEVIFAQVMRAFYGRPAPKGYYRIRLEDIPTDRTYRNALYHDGVAVQVDMGKAKDIHVALVQESVQPALDALNKQWMDAFGQGKLNDAAAIEAQRAVLRAAPVDAATAVAAARTVDDLKAIPITVEAAQATKAG